MIARMISRRLLEDATASDFLCAFCAMVLAAEVGRPRTNGLARSETAGQLWIGRPSVGRMLEQHGEKAQSR
jgi:hypothetical protein